MEGAVDTTSGNASSTPTMAFVSRKDEERPIFFTDAAKEQPRTITEAFKETVKVHGDRPALRFKPEGTNAWQAINFTEYNTNVNQVAKSLLKMGLQRFGCVAILGFNSPEWFMSLLGTIHAGGIGYGIYTTNGPEACEYLLKHSKTLVVIVENNVQLRKILEVRSRLPELKYIVQYRGQVTIKDDPNIMTWESFLNFGKDVTDADVQSRMSQVKPEHCAAIVYTSGTTGNPKGVMLSHDNITFTVNIVSQPLKIDHNDHLISFLPLSHVAAMMVDIFASVCLGNCVSFAQPDALKGSLGQSLKEVRPTAFLGVPRVWEKIAEGIQLKARHNGALKKAIAGWAKRKGLKGNTNKQEGKGMPSGWWLANKLVFSKVREALGLDRTRGVFSGAAPISMDTLQYFLSLNIPICEIYGMSETTGVITLSSIDRYRTGSCGFVPSRIEVKIVKADQDSNGEIAIRGRNVMLGYLDDHESTKSTFNDEGFLLSGDIGKADNDGFLRITGRIKELIITAGGENIPPVPIENAIKLAVPLVSQAIVIGDKRKYLVALLTIKCVPDDEGGPTEKLSEKCINDLKDAGLQGTFETVKDVIASKAITEYVERCINSVNDKAVSNAHTIRRWAFCPCDFSVPGNELGPTLKLKRRVINAKYSDLIDSLYT